MFLLLVAVLHPIALVVFINLNLAARYKGVFIWAQNLIYQLKLSTNFFLSVTHRKLPLLAGLLVFHIDQVDRVNAASQEQKPRNVHKN